MRTHLKFIAIAAVLHGLLGCTASNPVDPAAAGQATLVKHGPQPLALPPDSTLAKNGEATGTVTVAAGGQLVMNLRHGRCTVKLVLTFGPGSVANDIELRIVADKKTLSASFTPDGTQFLIPGSLSMEAHGLDLPSSDSAWLAQNLKLLYENPATGEWEPVPSDGFTVDVATGSITCTNGVINHFSRYGFGM
jgi:hypothetical protein